MDIQTEKKQKKTVDCKKTVAKVKKEKGKKQKREKNQKKRYGCAGCSRHQTPQMVWKRENEKKKRDTDALDAVASEHHRWFGK
jgi:hypothetical protein